MDNIKLFDYSHEAVSLWHGIEDAHRRWETARYDVENIELLIGGIFCNSKWTLVELVKYLQKYALKFEIVTEVLHRLIVDREKLMDEMYEDAEEFIANDMPEWWAEKLLQSNYERQTFCETELRSEF